MLLAGSGQPATIAYQGAYTPTISGLTATQTGVSFGTVGEDRLIIVAVHWNTGTSSGGGIASATIGGIAATVAIQGFEIGGASPFKDLAILTAYVPTGTTGTIVVTFNNSISVIGQFFVYQATNIRSQSPFGAGMGQSNGSPVNTTCNLQAGGVVVAAVTTWPFSTPMTFTGVTKNYDTSLGTSQGQYGGGCALTPTAVTGASFQQSDPGGPGGAPTHTMIVAAFR